MTGERAEREALVGRVAQLEAALSSTQTALTSTQTTLAQVTAERDKLRRAYEQLKEQLELLRRRIFQAKAERVDVTQLEIEFAQVKKEVDSLAIRMGDAAVQQREDGDPPDPPPTGTRPKPTGRRNLAAEEMPEERVEIFDPALEGVAERIGFEESCKLSYRRGSRIRIVVARARYRSTSTSDRPDEEPMIRSSPRPCPRSCSREGCSLRR